MGIQETIEAPKIFSETVQRDWDLARAWLYCELSGKQQDG
jgi:hypothetical protein